jgi:hypothetical protein
MLKFYQELNTVPIFDYLKIIDIIKQHAYISWKQNSEKDEKFQA